MVSAIDRPSDEMSALYVRSDSVQATVKSAFTAATIDSSAP
jgi:hypothetical protein